MTNRKLKGMALGLTLVLSLGMLAGCGGEKKAEQKKTVKVGIVQLVEHAALDAANKGFVDGSITTTAGSLWTAWRQTALKRRKT